MDTDSLSKTDRAVPTVSKDTTGEKENKLYARAAILTAAVSNSMMEHGSEEDGGGRQRCCTRRQEVCHEMDGTRLLIRSDLICGQTFYIWRYVGPATVLSGAIRPHKEKKIKWNTQPAH